MAAQSSSVEGTFRMCFLSCSKILRGLSKKSKNMEVPIVWFCFVVVLVVFVAVLVVLGGFGGFFSLRLIRKDLAFSSVLRREHRRDNLF